MTSLRQSAGVRYEGQRYKAVDFPRLAFVLVPQGDVQVAIAGEACPQQAAPNQARPVATADQAIRTSYAPEITHLVGASVTIDSAPLLLRVVSK